MEINERLTDMEEMRKHFDMLGKHVHDFNTSQTTCFFPKTSALTRKVLANNEKQVSELTRKFSMPPTTPTCSRAPIKRLSINHAVVHPFDSLHGSNSQDDMSVSSGSGSDHSLHTIFQSPKMQNRSRLMIGSPLVRRSEEVRKEGQSNFDFSGTKLSLDTSFVQQGPKKRKADIHTNDAVLDLLNFSQPSKKLRNDSVTSSSTKCCSFVNKTTGEKCQTKAVGSSMLCKKHGGGKRCKIEGCNKASQGSNSLCVSHGGGKRCTYPDCTRLARGKEGKLCIPHGGGNRCEVQDCTKLSQGGTKFCIRHGGGRRCQYMEIAVEPLSRQEVVITCNKSAVSNTNLCVAHGGGKRCRVPGCCKSAIGSTKFCCRHGGGKRCSFTGCRKSAVGKGVTCISHGGDELQETL